MINICGWWNKRQLRVNVKNIHTACYMYLNYVRKYACNKLMMYNYKQQTLNHPTDPDFNPMVYSI